jgi:HK97 family phage portal protein
MSIYNTLRRGLTGEPSLGTRYGAARFGLNGWTPNSRKNFAERAGKVYDNAVVLPAIHKVARMMSQAQLIVQENKGGEWVKAANSPAVTRVLDVLRRPNDYYSWTEAIFGNCLSWNIRGQSFMIKRRSVGGDMLGFYWVPHTQMAPASDGDDSGTKLITHYEYRPYGQTSQVVPVENVIMLRHGIDPEDTRCGLSPLGAALRDVCTENEAASWLDSILERGATPGYLLTVKPSKDVPMPSEEQMNRANEYIKSFVGDKRGESGFIPLPIDLISPSWSPNQMEIGKVRDIPVSRICAAIGGDPMVFGFPSESKTYSNYSEAEDAFGKGTILPTCSAWAEQIGASVLPDFGLDPARYRLFFDVSDVTWLADDVAATEERIRENWKAGAYDRFRYKELLGETPLPADKGIFYVDMLAGPTAATPATPPTKMLRRGSTSAMLVKRSKRPATKDRTGDTVIANRFQPEHDRLVKEAADKCHALAIRFGQGEITREEFLIAYDSVIALYHGKAYRLGFALSGSDVTDSEVRAHARQIADIESEFIQGFADAIEIGDYNGDEDLFNAESAGLRNRAGLYGKKVSSSASAGFVDGSSDSATFDWQLGGTEDNCADCPELAAAGSFTKDELITTPRAGDTPCKGNCKCRLVRNDGQEGFGPPI